MQPIQGRSPAGKDDDPYLGVTSAVALGPADTVPTVPWAKTAMGAVDAFAAAVSVAEQMPHTAPPATQRPRSRYKQRTT